METNGSVMYVVCGALVQAHLLLADTIVLPSLSLPVGAVSPDMSERSLLRSAHANQTEMTRIHVQYIHSYRNGFRFSFPSLATSIGSQIRFLKQLVYQLFRCCPPFSPPHYHRQAAQASRPLAVPQPLASHAHSPSTVPPSLPPPLP